MKFTIKMLLPRIIRQKNKELEKFIVQHINKELEEIKNVDCHYDLVQMQYFLESTFNDKEKIHYQQLRYKNSATSAELL